jgi:hypothetical protein
VSADTAFQNAVTANCPIRAGKPTSVSSQTSATEVWWEKEQEECLVDTLKKILQIRVEWALVWKWNNETGNKQNIEELTVR